MLLGILTALADGALDPVLTVCAMKEAIALLALMTLSHIVEHQGNLAPLIEVSMYIAGFFIYHVIKPKKRNHSIN